MIPPNVFAFCDVTVLLSLTRSTGQRLVHDADRASWLYDRIDETNDGAAIARYREELETLDRSIRVSITELVRLYP